MADEVLEPVKLLRPDEDAGPVELAVLDAGFDVDPKLEDN